MIAHLPPAPQVTSRFIYDDASAPTPSCHASTLIETRDGLLAAWFGGTAEGKPDVAIYTARFAAGRWTSPVCVLNGIQPDGQRHPCWNPVLFRPKVGPVLLFARIGPRPSSWWSVLMTSEDDGQTWSKPRRLPEGILGPIKNKPVEWPEGTLLCPSSTESSGQGWQVFMESTPDLGFTWTKSAPLNDGKSLGAIQPTVLTPKDGPLQVLCRTEQGRVGRALSKDQGKTWSAIELTDLPNPNSGIDAVTLAGGRHALVYNPVSKGRTPLSLAVSNDGIAWEPILRLEDQPGEYSYPAIIQTHDGLIHATYTWRRTRIKHVIVRLD